MGDYLSECLGGVFSRVIQRRSLIKEKLAFWNCHVSDRKLALKVGYDWQRVEINYRDHCTYQCSDRCFCNFLIHLSPVLYVEPSIMNCFTQDPTIKSPQHPVILLLEAL